MAVGGGGECGAHWYDEPGTGLNVYRLFELRDLNTVDCVDPLCISAEFNEVHILTLS